MSLKAEAYPLEKPAVTSAEKGAAAAGAGPAGTSPTAASPTASTYSGSRYSSRDSSPAPSSRSIAPGLRGSTSATKGSSTAVGPPPTRPRSQSDSQGVSVSIRPGGSPATSSKAKVEKPLVATSLQLGPSDRSQQHGRSHPLLPAAAPVQVAGAVQEPPEADSLRGIVAPGDVLFVRGSPGGLLELGTAGGLLGHVMLVVRPPEHVSSRSAHARYLKSVWPTGGVTDIWKVRCVESSRSREGLHEAELYLYIDRKTRVLMLLGELHDGEFDISNEAVELWQSPDALRSRLHKDIVEGVLKEMRDLVAMANWSWTTAIRAVVRGESEVDSDHNKAQLMEEITDCWAKDPICTSVVIHFWQRCLCKLARMLSANGTKKKPIDMILQWMPLKADRTLPGVLLENMRKCGWRQLTTAPTTREQPKPKDAGRSAEPVPAQPTPVLPTAPVAAKYCRAHDATHKRGKVEPRYVECSSCHVLIETNHAEFALCHHCSDKQDRCMNCGVACAAGSACAAASQLEACSPVHLTQSPTRPEEVQQRASVLRHMGSADFGALPGAGGSVMAPPPPAPGASVAASPMANQRFCATHSRSERRPKTEPRLRECMSCHVHMMTNHLDFAFCPSCSEAKDQCMLCGAAAAPEPRSFVPPPPLPLQAKSCPDIDIRLAGGSIFNFACEPPPPPLPSAVSQPATCPQRFCGMHNRTERRPKGEPRLRECMGCHVQIQTNYLDFTLCPVCSNDRDQCMICGSNASEGQGHNSFMPSPLPARPDEQPGVSRTLTLTNQAGQVPPCFCSMHDTTQKRPKVEMRFRECTMCRMQVQCNYSDMALCPPCSDRERRCMICGTGASPASACGSPCMLPPPHLMSPLPMPSLFPRGA